MHESDNESECSGNNIDYEISPLLRQHIKNTPGIEYVYGKDNKELLIEDAKIAYMEDKKDLMKVVSENKLQLTNFNYHFFEFSNQICTGTDANVVLNNKHIPYTCYAIYRISIHDLSLIVTKDTKTSKLAKLLRRKFVKLKKRNHKKTLLLITCNNDKGGKNQKLKQADQNKDHTNQNNKIASNKITKNGKIKKPKLIEHKGDNKVSVFNKKSKHRIEKFNAKCSKYWKNISNALSCVNASDTKKDLPTMEEKKHKRKKKHKRSKELPNSQDKVNYNNDEARQYRISTYLSDKDWKKNKMNDNILTEDSCPKVQSAVNFQQNKIELNHVRHNITSVSRILKNNSW